MIRTIARKLTALTLCLALVQGTAGAVYTSMGELYHSVSQSVGDGVTLDQGLFWSTVYSDGRVENYLTYTPGGTVTPVVRFGDVVTSRETLTDAAADLEAGGLRVAGGVNGDYYVVSTGVPLGVVITDGVLRSWAPGYEAVAFRADGTAFVGEPDLTVTMDTGTAICQIAAVNKIRSPGGIYLFTSDFSETTGNTLPGVDVILSTGDDLTVGGLVSATVVEVLEGTQATALSEGQMVLSVNSASDPALAETLRSLAPGSIVSLSVSSDDSAWRDAKEAVGGLYRLLKDGEVQSGLENEFAPRTAVGIRPDGTVILYTVDGRQPGYSIGAMMTMVANRLQELGCTEAMCLDGGGSTTLAATIPGDDGASLIDSPSGGYQRANSTCILLVSDASSSGGTAQRLHVYPAGALLLAGSSLQMTVAATDENWTRAELPGTPSFSADGGTVDADGLFTAAEAGDYTVSVRAGRLTASGSVTVVSEPTSIAVSNQSTGAAVSSLALSPAAQVDLTAGAYWYTSALRTSDTAFTWSCQTGTITADGIYTAAEHTTTDVITVSAGGQTLTIPVSVNGTARLMTGFDRSTSPFTGTPQHGAVSAEYRADHVKTGSGSARLDYDAEAGYALFPMSRTLPSGARYIGLSMSTTADVLTFALMFDTGEEVLYSTGGTDWEQVVLRIPDGAAALTGLRLYDMTEDGTLWVDQLMALDEDVTDDTAPTVTGEVADGVLTATVADNYDTAIDRDNVSVTWDGEALDFTLDGGALSSVLPEGYTGLHHLMVTASDRSGNLTRLSYTAGAIEDTAQPFVDMDENDADAYARFLYTRGITEGIPSADGLTYQPDKSMTRVEFTKMLASWLGMDVSAYADAEVPFADLDDVPAWGLDYVKAMYALGIMEGASDGVSLYAKPWSYISRAEAATIVGRALAQGGGEDALDYADRDEIPSWAERYMGVLFQTGAMGPLEGLAAPTDAITRAQVAQLLFSMT